MLDAAVQTETVPHAQGSERPVWRHVWRMVERHAGQVPIDELYGPAHLAEVARGSSVILSDRTSFRYVVGRSCSRFPHAQFYVAREPINTLSFGLYVNARLDTRFRRALDQRCASPPKHRRSVSRLKVLTLQGKWFLYVVGSSARNKFP
ncbi:hypothetical protein V5799_024613 [Amblyomma americanum]|uniref:Uncharacterized protein n=1 Tax=Amblyomma americanum TaxID=6943 RepID=A0AAQ4EC18_AMBAM